MQDATIRFGELISSSNGENRIRFLFQENKPTFEHLKKRLNEIENEASNILKAIRRKSIGQESADEAEVPSDIEAKWIISERFNIRWTEEDVILKCNVKLSKVYNGCENYEHILI